VRGRSLPDGGLLLPALAMAAVAVGNAGGVLVHVGGLAFGVRRQWGTGAAGRSRSLVLAGSRQAGRPVRRHRGLRAAVPA